VRAPQIGFPQLVQDFFLRRLVAQRGASARTVESYRDAFELLFGFAEQRMGKSPSALELADLNASLVLDFLDHLETERGNSVRTRNARLAAIHSFMRYAAVRDPASLPITQQVLASLSHPDVRRGRSQGSPEPPHRSRQPRRARLEALAQPALPAPPHPYP
jgi:integrase/recombinase XerD